MMTLTPELIEEAKKFFPKEAFVASEKVIAQHNLYKQFSNYYPNWPKIIFYIVCDKCFGPSYEKDGNGDLGRKLKFDITLVPEHLKPKLTP